MQIGAYQLYPIETGTFALDGGAMFGVIPKNLWQKTNPPDEQNRIGLALRALLLKGHGKVILIDCGIGTKFTPKWSQIYRIDLSRDNLGKNLAVLGLSPEDVTDVIISHLHFDHVGGATYREDEALKLTFPNARHYIQEEQWRWALSPSQKDRASFMEENLLPLEKSGQLHLLSGEHFPAPDIKLIPMFGHTPAMQLVYISDGSASLLYCADLIPTRSHIALPWVMAYDNHPLQTIKEKLSVLTDAVRSHSLLFFEHDPETVACYVEHDSKNGFYAGTSFTRSDFNDI